MSVADHCLRTTDYINVIVADKQKHLQFTTIDDAVVHCTKGLGIWKRASTDAGEEPDVVLASCGDVATQQALAAVAILRERVPDLKLRFVNVVDLFKLQPSSVHPHGSTESEFDDLFTADKPIIFTLHGYPWLIHRLGYRFKGHENMHVHGYHNLSYAHEHGIDRPEISDWTWPDECPARPCARDRAICRQLSGWDFLPRKPAGARFPRADLRLCLPKTIRPAY